jgi:hypothetical protein
MKAKTVLFLSFLIVTSAFTQDNSETSLFSILQKNDSLIFAIGFNTCDLSQFDNLMTDNLEFFHDKSGIIKSKKEFLEVMKNGLCKNKNYQARRELIKGSLIVYPLFNNNIIYGAVQTGEHRFYEKMEGKAETAGSIAKFTHVWLLAQGTWKLDKVLSYDHQLKKN